MAGVKVGSVTDISLDPKSYKAVVTFTMRKGVQVPDDSTVQVVSDGLLGGAYLGILVGGSFDYVAEGGTVEFTRGSVDLLTVLSEVASSAAGGGNNNSRDDAGDDIGGDIEKGASP
jgi:phospholipid/cholesterol/gamma-HCH transport system substrate-binding protein